MNVRKVFMGALIAILLATGSAVIMRPSAYAQCIGALACPTPVNSNSGSGERQRRPTKTPTVTPTYTPTATTQALELMPLPAGNANYTPTVSWIYTAAAETEAAATQQARDKAKAPLAAPVGVTPVAGTMFPPIGPLGMLILVVFVALGAGGIIIVVRSRIGGSGGTTDSAQRGAGKVRPPTPNLQDDQIAQGGDENIRPPNENMPGGTG